MEVKYQLMLSAAQESLRRAARVHPQDPVAFAAYAEATWWITTIDEFFGKWDKAEYQKARNKDPRGKMIAGLRYARNRLTHDKDITAMHSAILEAKDGEVHWKWRSPKGLVPPDRPQNKRTEDAYKELVGESVLVSLRMVLGFLETYPFRTHRRVGTAR